MFSHDVAYFNIELFYLMKINGLTHFNSVLVKMDDGRVIMLSSVQRSAN